MVKAGYKQTEIGLIPEDWEVIKVRDIANIFGRIGFRGYTVNDIVKEGYGAISLSPSNITNNKINYNNCTYISWFKYEESPEIKIKDNDVLLVKTGSTVGKTAIVKELKEKATLNPQIVVFKNLKIDAKLFSFLVSDKLFQNQIISSVVGGAIPTLSQEQVYNFKIPLPPLPEQTAIAEALSDADAWIESLAQLIAKKRLLKQGAMQTLLTPKENWEVKKLGEFIRFQTGFPFSSEFFNTDLIGQRLIKNRDLRSDDSIFHYSGDYKSEFIVNNGDLLIGMDGDFEPVLWKKGKALLNQRVGRVLKIKEISIDFLSFALIKELKDIENSTGSTTVKHLSHSDIENIVIQLPNIKEQTRIATILSDMDAELEALEAQLEKAKQIKQGMMQELLTGRVRLV